MKIHLETESIYTSSSICGKRLIFLLSQHPNTTQITTKLFPMLDLKKGYRMTPFIINEKLFLIDEWDYGYPTNDILNRGIPEYYSNNNATILKIQYNINDINIYNQIFQIYNIRIVPFIIFPNSKFNLSNFFWFNNASFKFTYAMTGKPWRNRRFWLRYASQHHRDTSFVACDVKGGEVNSLSQMDHYDKLLQSCRWGLILKGRGGGGKNRREFEFSSCGMPLALNYKPHYHFDFEPNYHYVYLEKPEDLNRLYDIDPQPYSERSWEIYKKYFSPEPNGGLYNSFMHFYNH